MSSGHNLASVVVSSGHNLASVVVPWLTDEWLFMDILVATNIVSVQENVTSCFIVCRSYRFEKMGVYYVYQW